MPAARSASGPVQGAGGAPGTVPPASAPGRKPVLWPTPAPGLDAGASAPSAPSGSGAADTGSSRQPAPDPTADVTTDAGADGAAADVPAQSGGTDGSGRRDDRSDGPRAAAPRRGWAAWRERMPLWAQGLQARCGLERRSVVALVVLLAVAVAFALQHFWTGRTVPVRAPQAVGSPSPRTGQDAGSPAGASTGPSGGSSAGGGPATGRPSVVVDVAGKVRRPGLQRLPAGARVADALRAAGGVRPGVSTDGLNRARLLVDGEQVIVGDPPAAGSGGAPASGVSGANGAAPGTPVSLNSATPEQLETLPGVGPVLARHIVDYRTRHGGFRSVDELREVHGIGDRRFSDLRDLVRP